MKSTKRVFGSVSVKYSSTVLDVKVVHEYLQNLSDSNLRQNEFKIWAGPDDMYNAHIVCMSHWCVDREDVNDCIVFV